jgi:hypothetical protein
VSPAGRRNEDTIDKAAGSSHLTVLAIIASAKLFAAPTPLALTRFMSLARMNMGVLLMAAY